MEEHIIKHFIKSAFLSYMILFISGCAFKILEEENPDLYLAYFEFEMDSVKYSKSINWAYTGEYDELNDETEFYWYDNNYDVNAVSNFLITFDGNSTGTYSSSTDCEIRINFGVLESYVANDSYGNILLTINEYGKPKYRVSGIFQGEVIHGTTESHEIENGYFYFVRKEEP